MCRLLATHSSISSSVSPSKLFMRIVIHPQHAPDFRRSVFQAHPALESKLHFRLTPYWNQTSPSGSSCIGQFLHLLFAPRLRQARKFSDTETKTPCVCGCSITITVSTARPRP